jgi:uncharacterized protein YciI
MRLFAVIRTCGPAWQTGLPLEGQPAWDAHARFMEGLEARNKVILAGPLDGTPDALFIMRADSPEEIATSLEEDPWTALDLLRVREIHPWTLRLGSLPNPV